MSFSNRVWYNSAKLIKVLSRTRTRVELERAEFGPCFDGAELKLFASKLTQ